MKGKDMDIQAVIFDMDGTIVDTEHIWTKANEILLREMSIQNSQSLTKLCDIFAKPWSVNILKFIPIHTSLEKNSCNVKLQYISLCINPLYLSAVKGCLLLLS